MPLKSSPKRKECGDDTSLTSPTPDQRAPKVKRTDTSPTSPTPDQRAPKVKRTDTSPTSPTLEERAAKVKLDRFNCERELDRNIIGGKLAELHTHLLGMGSADFWVSRIMKVYLPRVLQDIEVNISKKNAESKEAEAESIFETLAKDFCKRPFLPKGFAVSEGNQTTNPELSKYWVEELKEIWGEEKLDLSLFTYDVVYGVKQLCKGFNIVRFNDIDIDTDDGNARDANHKADLESLLTPTVECSHQWEFNARCKKWVIFNQRNWEFEEVEGITNTDLIELIELSPEVLASVRNAFEMLGTSGHKPTEGDRRAQFRGNFTPAFYPQRYALKDCIYEQRIEVLAILLNQVLSRYAKAGVKYVEFSVSAKDMAESRILQTMVFDSFRIADYEGDDKRLEPEDEYLRVIKSSLDFLQDSLNREATSEEKINTKELIQRCKNITEAASENIGCPLNGLEEDGRNEASSKSLQAILKEINKILEGKNCFLSYADVLDAQVLGEQIQGCSGISQIQLDRVLLFLREQSPNREQAKDASVELRSWLEGTEMKNIYLQEKLDVISRRLVFLNRFTDVRKKLQAILAECCGIEKPNEMLPDIHFEEDAKVSFHKKLLENAKRLLATLKEENSPQRESSTGNESSVKEEKPTANEILSRIKNTIEENASTIKTTVAQYFGELLREEVKSSRVKYKIFVERKLAERKLKSDLKLNHRRSTTYANFYIRVLRDHIIDYATKKALQSGKVKMVNKQMLHAFLNDRLGKLSWEPSWIETYGLYNEYPQGMQFRFLAAFSRVTPFKTLAKSYIDCFLSAEELADSNVDKIKSKVERAASLSGFNALSFIISLHKFRGGSAHLDDELCREDFLRKLYVHECDVNSSQNNEEANKQAKQKPDYERVLKKLEDSLNKDRLLCHFLVGLDWVGDELFMPTNWFCTNVVIDFVKWCKKTFNEYFGLRVHGGEGVQRHRANKNAGKAQQVYLLCMHTLITGITKIVEADIRLRIGHGVAFCVSWAGLGLPKERNPQNLTNGLEETIVRKKTYVRSAATEIIGSERDFEDLYYRLRDFLKRCGERNVPFEINPTSNDMLLLDTHGTSARAPDQALGAFSSLLELSQSGDSVSWNSGFPRPIICTDNDGIWAIHKCQKHYQHVSIAGEICDLIQRCGNNHPLLLKGAIDRLVDTRGFYFIDVDDPQTPSKEPVDMLSSDSGIEIDNQVHDGEDK